MKKFAFLALASLSVGASAANLVSNAGFESNDWDLSGGYKTYNAGDSTGITDWTVGGVSVDLVNSSYPVHSGSVANDLAGTPGPGSVMQSISGTSAIAYTVGVWALNTAGGINSLLTVTFGSTSQTFTTTGSWDYYSFTATGDAGSTLLTLATDPGNTTNGNLIVDDAMVEAVPEPATMAVLGLGLAAIGRRRKKA
jgi:hypothetical protein